MEFRFSLTITRAVSPFANRDNCVTAAWEDTLEVS